MKGAGGWGLGAGARRRRFQHPASASRGVNLVELVIAIVVLTIAVGGVLLVFTQAVRFSADPMVQQQAIAIAEGYLDEILLQPAADPDGSDAGETRATFDDVMDYNGLSESPPRDQNGTVLNTAPADLTGYAVSVTVTATALGPAGNTVPAKRVDVRVTYGTIVDVTLTGYRAL